MASPYFKKLVHDKRQANQPLRLDVEESQTPLEIVLRLTYPIPDPVIMDLDDLTDTYCVAVKYELPAATQALRRMLSLPRFMERDPLRVYAIAVRFGLDDEAEHAAKLACKLPVRDWPACEEFDHIPASRYHDLFLYHKRRGTEAGELLTATKFYRCKPALCDGEWLKAYKSRAVGRLAEVPADDHVFTLQYIYESCTATSRVHICTGCLDNVGNLLKIQAVLDTAKGLVYSTQLKVKQGK